MGILDDNTQYFGENQEKNIKKIYLRKIKNH